MTRSSTDAPHSNLSTSPSHIPAHPFTPSPVTRLLTHPLTLSPSHPLTLSPSCPHPRPHPHPLTLTALQVKGGLKHILVKETRDRLAAPKGRDTTSLMKLLALLADGLLEHVASMFDEDEDFDETRHALCRLIDTYNAYMELSRVAAPTGA